MKNYIDLVKEILRSGNTHEDRTKVGRRSLFSRELRFDLSQGFPLVTTRKMPIKPFIHELLWHLSGKESVDYLKENNVTIWDSWAVRQEHVERFIQTTIKDRLLETIDPGSDVSQLLPGADLFMDVLKNSVGPIYGANWRYAPGQEYNAFRRVIPHEDIDKRRLAEIKEEYAEFIKIYKETHNTEAEVMFDEYIQSAVQRQIDQVQNLIISLKRRPWSSRHVITAWVPQFIPDEELSPQENVILGYGALAPCPVLQQYFVSPPLEPGGSLRLSMKMVSRSCDLLVGGATNIAQYSLLLVMIAQAVKMEPYEFIFSMGDVHVYRNQIPIAEEQIKREPKPLPTLVLNKCVENIFDFTADDIAIHDYNSHGLLKYPVAV